MEINGLKQSENYHCLFKKKRQNYDKYVKERGSNSMVHTFCIPCIVFE